MRGKRIWTTRTLQRVITLLLLTALSGLAILKIQSNAYLYVSFVWLVMISVFVKSAKTDKKRLFGIYAGSIFLTCFIAEIYFSGLLETDVQQRINELEVIYGGNNQSDRLLGYTPVPNSKWSVKATHGDSVVFDAIQTIDDQGLRLTPGDVAENAEPILFLGCSFTFGSGLNDNETLPYYFQSESSGLFKSINMGRIGYGAHQVLAILESGLEKEVLSLKKPKAAVYSVITDYVFRGTGRLGETVGPRYVLNESGKPEKISNTPFYITRLLHELHKSHALSHFLDQRSHSKEKEVDLVAAMIGESSRLFTEKYNAPFYCLLWDEMYAEEGLYEKLQDRLRNYRINVIEVKDILPDYEQQPGKYAFHHDAHPNALANQLIGEYLSEMILADNL